MKKLLIILAILLATNLYAGSLDNWKIMELENRIKELENVLYGNDVLYGNSFFKKDRIQKLEDKINELEDVLYGNSFYKKDRIQELESKIQLLESRIQLLESRIQLLEYDKVFN